LLEAKIPMTFMQIVSSQFGGIRKDNIFNKMHLFDVAKYFFTNFRFRTHLLKQSLEEQNKVFE
jgi:hypothetical protein